MYSIKANPADKLPDAIIVTKDQSKEKKLYNRDRNILQPIYLLINKLFLSYIYASLMLTKYLIKGIQGYIDIIVSFNHKANALHCSWLMVDYRINAQIGPYNYLCWHNVIRSILYHIVQHFLLDFIYFADISNLFLQG